MEAGCQEVAWPQMREGPISLPEYLKAAAAKFYVRDDISRQAPGKRDPIVVRTNNEKKKMQRQHLSMNISEAYQIFKQQNPDKNISRSKFASLRLGHVLLSSQMPRNVCVCRQHQNMTLILKALHKFDETFLYIHMCYHRLYCATATVMPVRTPFVRTAKMHCCSNVSTTCVMIIVLNE